MKFEFCIHTHTWQINTPQPTPVAAVYLSTPPSLAAVSCSQALDVSTLSIRSNNYPRFCVWQFTYIYHKIYMYAYMYIHIHTTSWQDKQQYTPKERERERHTLTQTKTHTHIQTQRERHTHTPNSWVVRKDIQIIMKSGDFVRRNWTWDSAATGGSFTTPPWWHISSAWYVQQRKSGSRITTCYRVPGSIPVDKFSKFHQERQHER